MVTLAMPPMPAKMPTMMAALVNHLWCNVVSRCGLGVIDGLGSHINHLRLLVNNLRLLIDDLRLLIDDLRLLINHDGALVNHRRHIPHAHLRCW